MMAKPKKDVIVEVLHNKSIRVWCNNPGQVVTELKTIEGITSILYLSTFGSIHLSTDPRYDISEIAQEIEELLTAEVPDVFKD